MKRMLSLLRTAALRGFKYKGGYPLREEHTVRFKTK